MKFEINMQLLKQAKERGFCPCEVEKVVDDNNNVCPCDEFLYNQLCKCGVFKQIKNS